MSNPIFARLILQHVIQEWLRKSGVIPRFAMDLTTCDEHGYTLDFNSDVMRDKATKLIKSKAALLLVVSHMRAAFTRLQTFNAKRMGVGNMKETLQYGLKQFTLALDLCEIQRRSGLYVLFEHPDGGLKLERDADTTNAEKKRGSNICGRSLLLRFVSGC